MNNTKGLEWYTRDLHENIIQQIQKYFLDMDDSKFRDSKPLIKLSRKNKFRVSPFHSAQAVVGNIEILQKCYEIYIQKGVLIYGEDDDDRYDGPLPSLSQCFPDFTLSEKNEGKSNQISGKMNTGKIASCKSSAVNAPKDRNKGEKVEDTKVAGEVKKVNQKKDEDKVTLLKDKNDGSETDKTVGKDDGGETDKSPPENTPEYENDKDKDEISDIDDPKDDENLSTTTAADKKDDDIRKIKNGMHGMHEVQVEHPLRIIAETEKLALIQHPYIQMYVHLLWHYFARYPFYVYSMLYCVFFVFFVLFIIFPEKNVSGSMVLGSSQNSNGSLSNSQEEELSSDILYTVPTIAFAILGLIGEIWQLKIRGKMYFKRAENNLDLIIFPSALILASISLAASDSWSVIRSLGCILIAIATLRAAFMFDSIPYVGVNFRLVLEFMHVVLKFIPVLLLFVIVFGVIFHALVDKQEPFPDYGHTFMKVLAMAVGELEQGTIFFGDDGPRFDGTVRIVTFLLFALFLFMVTISIMNLLIGIAAGEIDELRKKAKQLVFRSKVENILHYNMMFTKQSLQVHSKGLHMFDIWHRKKRFVEKDLKSKMIHCCLYIPRMIFRVVHNCPWFFKNMGHSNSRWDSAEFQIYLDMHERRYKKYGGPTPTTMNKDTIDKSDIHDIMNIVLQLKHKIDQIKIQHDKPKPFTKVKTSKLDTSDTIHAPRRDSALDNVSGQFGQSAVPSSEYERRRERRNSFEYRRGSFDMDDTRKFRERSNSDRI